ncbi:hypothetical protein CTA1_8587 [Colletotrichum tanaceti]|uniref:Uncharacterized protein n=1 Tax=Colletotrichum tanaceti TaxID=1306861 RepID=A0A4V6DGB5_9PEZI|nr:hypothetical protein CTA1_8587 [Colletotrichum tanaceti]
MPACRVVSLTITKPNPPSGTSFNHETTLVVKCTPSIRKKATVVTSTMVQAKYMTLNMGCSLGPMDRIAPKPTMRPLAPTSAAAAVDCRALMRAESVDWDPKSVSGCTTRITPTSATRVPTRSITSKVPKSRYRVRIMAVRGPRKFKAVASLSLRYMIETTSSNKAKGPKDAGYGPEDQQGPQLGQPPREVGDPAVPEVERAGRAGDEEPDEQDLEGVDGVVARLEDLGEAMESRRRQLGDQDEQRRPVPLKE